MNVTEQQLETSTIGWFGKLSWHYANVLDIAFDGGQPIHTNYRRFVQMRLPALPRVNSHTPATATEQATHAFLSSELSAQAAASDSEAS